MQLFAGLDIGTNGVRIVVADKQLKIKYQNSKNYNVDSPEAGWAQQQPLDIYKACQDLFGKLVSRFPEDDIHVTFSSVMHSIMVVDEQGNNVTPLIIWADTRALEKKEFLEEKHGNDFFYDRTTCNLHSSYWPAKILWLKDEIKEIGGLNQNNLTQLAQYKFVSIKEYIIHRLTGDWMVDEALASTSGIFNLLNRDYDREILDIVGVTTENLSDLVPVSRTFKFKIAGKKLTGIMGATDGVLANLGAGVIDDEKTVLTAGTSSAVRMTIEEPIVDQERHNWCYILDDEYYVMGQATNGAGILIKWLSDILGYDDEKKMIAENMPGIPYKQNDIVMIPTLMGERGPDYKEDIRGLIYGLSLNHQQQDLIIALYESTAFFLKMIFADMLRVREEIPELLLMTGGLGLSECFSELMSYLVGDTYYLPGHTENTAVGAAMLGLKTICDVDYNELIEMLPARSKINICRNEDFAVYLDNKYRRFSRIYHELIENRDKYN